MPRTRIHGATITGRIRSDRGLLLLMGLVVAVTVAMTAAAAPLTERTADRAIEATVRDAGLRGAVIATMPEWFSDRRARTRIPNTLVEIRQDTDYAQDGLPPRLAAVLRPGVATVTTPALHLLDAGPGRYLRLAFVDAPDGPPQVTYTAGSPPKASVGAGGAEVTLPSDAGAWPVQVALSEAAADALGLKPGDRVPAEDAEHREVLLRISGIYTADETDDDAWQLVTELLTPSQGATEGLPRTSAAALVSAESLPDLRLGVPDDDLTRRIVFLPEASLMTSRHASALEQEVVSLQTSAGLARGDISWDSLLDRVLDDGRTQVSAARGQAQVLLLGLLACALMVLVLAAQLLVRRRTGSVTMARERGASLLGIGVELLVESVAVTAAGAAVGLGVVWLLVGSVGWSWPVPVLVVAALAAPVLGAAAAGRAAGARRVPANRTARRTAARAVHVRRIAIELGVLAVATLAFVALRQRGVVGGEDGGDLTAASAATWWAGAGALVVLRLLPPAVLLALRTARRTAGGVGFLVSARLVETVARALPLLVVSVATAQLTFGVALAATEREGQVAGSLLSVGGDARLTTAPDPALVGTTQQIADAPGVRAAASGRVADGVLASSRSSADRVRLVVLDADAYQRLLDESALPDAPQLARLDADPGERVPALLLGGDAGLRDGLVLAWDEVRVPLDVVGTAPSVGLSADPVVVVDTGAFAAAGALAQPDTVWAVGPGAASAVETAAGGTGSVTRYDDELDARRDAPLPSALVGLAVAASLMLLLFAVLAVVLAAATEAPGRAESLGRLRALGLRDRDLRRILVGELLTPVVVAALAGLALGIGSAHAMFGSLSLERITGQTTPPEIVVPGWITLVVVALVLTVLVVASVEWRRLHRRVLAQLLRS